MRTLTNSFYEANATIKMVFLKMFIILWGNTYFIIAKT